MGRAPCCDKANVKKGPWSPEEDAKLKAYIEQNGTGGNWIALPQKIGLKRCGKSCRLRWLNYLRPNIKHGGFSEEEDNIICSLYINIGSRWSIIAAQLPGRTDNDIKNYWNTRLKKKLLGKQRKEQHQTRRASLRPEIKREPRSFISPIAATVNQQPAAYWPELPSSAAVMPVMNTPIQGQDSDFLDQESLRNLLIKLGGRFSDHESNVTNIIYPLDGSNSCSSHRDHPYASSSMTMISSTTGNSMDTTCSQLPNNMFDITTELDEMVYGNNHLQLQGMGSLYGVNTGDEYAVSSASGESTSWGNVCSWDYPQLVSDFENCLHSLPQHHSPFEVSSYLGPQ